MNAEISIRSQLAARTEERLMHSMADLLVEPEDFSFRGLAEISGVSERTIYRYYPTKEAIFAAFWVWLNNHMGMPAGPRSPDDLINQIPQIFAAFERHERLIRVMLHSPHGRETRNANNAARRERLREALAVALSNLSESAQTRLLASVQALIAAAGWETMKDYWGVTWQEAAVSAQWAVRALIEQARRGNG